MDAFLAIALLVVGATATLAAFGGKTWHDGSDPIIDRITVRGWVSVGCLAIALALGAWKEVRTNSAKATAQSEADLRQTTLNNRLTEAQHQAQLSALKLSNMQETLNVTRQYLDDTRRVLSKVQHNLDETHEDLNHQISASSISALVGGDQRVESIQVLIPFTSKGRRSANLNEAALPEFQQRICTDLTGVTVFVATQGDHYEGFDSRLHDPGKNAFYDDQGIPKAEAVLAATSPDEVSALRALLKDMNQTSTNGHIFAEEIYTLGNHNSAASLYALLTTPGAFPLQIRTKWPGVALTREDLAVLGRTYQGVVVNADAGFFSPSGMTVSLADKHPFPSSCASAAEAYFQSAFENASLEIVLDRKQHETIGFRLRALKPRKAQGDIVVPFQIIGPPRFSASEDFSHLLDGVSWPAEKAKQ